MLISCDSTLGGVNALVSIKRHHDSFEREWRICWSKRQSLCGTSGLLTGRHMSRGPSGLPVFSGCTGERVTAPAGRPRLRLTMDHTSDPRTMNGSGGTIPENTPCKPLTLLSELCSVTKHHHLVSRQLKGIIKWLWSDFTKTTSERMEVSWKIPQEKFYSWTFRSNYQDITNKKNVSQEVSTV